jgi:dipeptidyl aminopeptidase/acylaminoacyl peptidase
MSSIRALARPLLLSALLAGAAEAGTRPIGPDDIAAVKAVADPQVDPAGAWVAYTVESTDLAADKAVEHLWMTRWDGTRTVQLTARKGESESTPRFSPDGRSLAFISSRGEAHEDDQLWIMDRAGGEGVRQPGITGSVTDLAWSPDGRTIALVVLDPDPDAKANAAAQAVTPSPAKPGAGSAPTSDPSVAAPPASGGAPDDDDKADVEKKPKPIVIDRFQFKQDIDGYLRTRRQRLWLYDLATHEARRLTTGDFDEQLPAWSPDGARIAFTSHRDADPDRNYDSNLYLADVGAGASEPRALTSFAGEDNSAEWSSYPAWSPDGRRIAYLQGGPPRLFSYGVRTLAVVPAAGGQPTVLTPSLDRNVTDPVWASDGKTIRFLVEDDQTVRLAQVGAIGGAVRPVAGGFRVFSSPSRAPGGRLAVLLSTPSAPDEVYAVEPNGSLRQLSHQNDAWLAQVAVAPVTRTTLASKDGTEVHGFLVNPPAAATRPFPTVLFNHGGPQAQFDASFDLDWQILAGHGYAVVATNPRGSTGRGEAYAKALFGDWGGPAVPDALSAVDDAVARGIADPQRLYVGGWSYGGMLTNYLIASDTRFAAAVSGASIGNALAGYGTDQYIRDYEAELGTPWANMDRWLKVSYPFYHNDRIVTPTLFMAGDKDFNVPLLNSEQMYQALRSRNVPTRLVIYPGEFHGLKRPSFLVDRMRRWLAWYDQHGGRPTSAGVGTGS